MTEQLVSEKYHSLSTHKYYILGDIIRRNHLYLESGTIRKWSRLPQIDVQDCIVAEINGKPVGAAILKKDADIDPYHQVYYNLNIFVLPDYRRFGIGKKIFSLLTERNQSFIIKPWRMNWISSKFYESILHD